MINQVILIGNLGADPEQRQADNGSAVANFSVATSIRWKGSNGQMQDETEWHRIVAFGRLAEICGQYLTKGSKVYIEERLHMSKWEDQQGNAQYTTQIIANEMKMLDSRAENNSNDGLGTDTPPASNFDFPKNPFKEKIPFQLFPPT